MQSNQDPLTTKKDVSVFIDGKKFALLIEAIRRSKRSYSNAIFHPG
jgi:hypothetical protein